MSNPTDIAIVLGTYNRLPLLRGLVESVRRDFSPRGQPAGWEYDLIVVDGGSNDGTQEWLDQQDDCEWIDQGGLQGAVHAFNLGFTYAVKNKYDYIVHLNDDAELVSPLEDGTSLLWHACEILEHNPKVGEVAFAFNLRGGFGFDQWNGKTLANFGMIRREAGMAVAVAQGDPTGCLWWNPIYRTYGGDSEFCCNLWKLDWEIHAAWNLKVKDLNSQDSLRDKNNSGQTDSALFFSRWKNEVWG